MLEEENGCEGVFVGKSRRAFLTISAALLMALAAKQADHNGSFPIPTSHDLMRLNEEA